MMRQHKQKGASRVWGASRGQSMLEFALFLPVLLILLAGLIEIGAYANVYMLYLDASREGARFGSNVDPELTVQHPFDYRTGNPPFPDVTTMTPAELRAVCNNGETTNFYYEVACLAFQNIPLGSLDPSRGDDVVVSVIGVQNGAIVHRWPLPSHRNPTDHAYHFRGADGDHYCWSLYGVRESDLANSDLAGQLRSGAPDTGFVIVEIYHSQDHFTGLFTIGEFIPNPIPFRAYSVFPVSAAEPD